MSDYVQLNDTNDLPSFLLNPDVNNTANVPKSMLWPKVVAIPLCIMDMCPYEDERHAAKMERRHSQSYKECDFLRK